MKKLLVLFIPFLSLGQDQYIPQSRITPCQCTDIIIGALNEYVENLDMIEEEKYIKKWEKKMKPCEEKIEADSEFKKEFEKCLEIRISIYLAEEKSTDIYYKPQSKQ